MSSSSPVDYKLGTMMFYDRWNGQWMCSIKADDGIGYGAQGEEVRLAHDRPINVGDRVSFTVVNIGGAGYHPVVAKITFHSLDPDGITNPSTPQP